MAIKIEFPADNKEVAGHLGRALLAYADEIETLKLVQRSDGLKEQATEPTDTDDEPTDTDDEQVDTAAAFTPDGTDGGLAAEFAAQGEQQTAGRVDEKGVAFDADYCAEAKDPFYGSGAREGQWKKKRGVDDSTYAEWYAQQKAAATTPEDTEQVDTAAAFTPNNAAESAEPDAPKTAAEFMAWCSEQQAAGHFTPEVVRSAYTSCGVSIEDLFPQGLDDEQAKAQVAELVGRLYASLQGAAG